MSLIIHHKPVQWNYSCIRAGTRYEKSSSYRYKAGSFFPFHHDVFRIVCTGSKKDHKQSVLAVAYFIERANNSFNSLNGLLKKDNYRNKITTLNNPSNNELGFSLKQKYYRL
jgi:hypothetical protein